MAREARLDELAFPIRGGSLADFLDAWSEPETGTPAENLVSNEDSYTRILSELAERPVNGGAYLGVGPEQNFSLIASARPDLAVIVDYRRRNALVHLLHKALFAMSTNRVEYLAGLLARNGRGADADSLVDSFAREVLDRGRLDAITGEVRRYLKPLGVVAAAEWDEVAGIHAKLAGPGMGARFLGLPGYPTIGRMIRSRDRDGRPSHCLASDERYRFLRDFQRDDRILPVVGDFAGARAMPKIAEGLRSLGIGLSTVYVSDMEFFLLRAGTFQAYVRNLDAMPRRPGAVIVRTSTRPIDHKERAAGDQCTTIVRDLDSFLEDAKRGRIRSADDLFRP